MCLFDVEDFFGFTTVDELRYEIGHERKGMASAGGQQPQCWAEKPEHQLANELLLPVRFVPRLRLQQFRLDKFHIRHARLNCMQGCRLSKGRRVQMLFNGPVWPSEF